MLQRSSTWLAGAVTLLLLASAPASAAPSLQDYKYFRALSIDLLGRAPTLDEVTAFGAPGFDVNQWIEDHLQGPAYAERIRTIYMDLLRLQIGPQFNYQGPFTMHRQLVLMQKAGGGQQWIHVYFRNGQRRDNLATDGDFCLESDDTGYMMTGAGVQIFCAPDGGPGIVNGYKAVPESVVTARTVKVKPWWLWRDYENGAAATDRFDPASGWGAANPTFRPVNDVVTQPFDGGTLDDIYVCKEESGALENSGNGRIFNRDAGVYDAGAPTGSPCDPGRAIKVPANSSYTRAHAGEAADCSTNLGATTSAECGCGPGMERCMPAATAGNDPRAFRIPTEFPIGIDDPTTLTDSQQSAWWRLWWGEEAAHFLDHVVENDLDFRGVLTAPYSVVNGPLVQWYRGIALQKTMTSTMAGTFGYLQPARLVELTHLPPLKPQDTETWSVVTDRGPRAAGLLTTPIFLTKYGTRRARAHILYQAFLCKEFIAEDTELMAGDTNPNLMERQGCNACHRTLEPLASYFTRIVESDWSYLPQDKFPRVAPDACMTRDGGVTSTCAPWYDPAVRDSSTGKAQLKGSYAMPAAGGALPDGEQGPQGIAQWLTAQPEFASCVAENVASSFLGRALTHEDEALKQSLRDAFVGGGADGGPGGGAYRMRSLVRALVKADAYRRANNLSSAVWREGQGQ